MQFGKQDSSKDKSHDAAPFPRLKAVQAYDLSPSLNYTSMLVGH